VRRTTASCGRLQPLVARDVSHMMTWGVSHDDSGSIRDVSHDDSGSMTPSTGCAACKSGAFRVDHTVQVPGSGGAGAELWTHLLQLPDMTTAVLFCLVSGLVPMASCSLLPAAVVARFLDLPGCLTGFLQVRVDR
jgi:hypothetical protein